MSKDKDKDKEKKEVSNNIPEGMKCFQKTGGGSHRFENRIIKTGQKFWIDPNAIPKAFADIFKEVAPDFGAVVIGTNLPIKVTKAAAKHVTDKFEVIIATDEDGNVITKGKDSLYNVIGEDGKPINDKPLRKGKADELQAALNV
jgi:hypothetical protein